MASNPDTVPNVKHRPAGTYSIIALDADAGQIGVAVQSHWFAVGASVAWAAAGVGAVATQSFIEPAYGTSGLDLIRSGQSASKALDHLLQADALGDTRQVAMLDAGGNVAAHTGSRCVAAAGHVTCDTFNLGSGVKTTVGEVAEWALKYTGHRPAEIKWINDKPTTIKYRALDVSKLKSAVAWQPEHTIEAGVEKTAQWWLDHQETWTR